MAAFEESFLQFGKSGIKAHCHNLGARYHAVADTNRLELQRILKDLLVEIKVMVALFDAVHCLEVLVYISQAEHGFFLRVFQPEDLVDDEPGERNDGKHDWKKRYRDNGKWNGHHVDHL